MNAVIYVRRSKESGAKQVSLETQILHCKVYAARIGATVEGIVSDDGVSGGDRDRFLEIHDACRIHAAKIVIVYHLDRFARDAEACLHHVRLLAKKGIDVHVVGEGRIDIASSSGLLMTTVHAALAEHYRLVVSEKTRDALAHLKACGRRYSGLPPYGYAFGPDGALNAIADEQHVLALAQSYQRAGASLRHIAQRLEEEGHLARSGRPFSPSTLAGILRRKDEIPTLVGAR